MVTMVKRVRRRRGWMFVFEPGLDFNSGFVLERRSSRRGSRSAVRAEVHTATTALFLLHETWRSLGDITELERTVIRLLGLGLDLLGRLGLLLDLLLDVRGSVVRVRVGLDLALLGGGGAALLRSRRGRRRWTVGTAGRSGTS
jgi:hypothetical protein